MDDPDAAFYQQCTLYESRSTETQLEIPSDDWRYQTCLELCTPKPNQSLLDIGCGDGGFLALAQSKGFNVFGIDIDDRAIRLARSIRNLEHVKSGAWEKLQSIEGWKEFDTITLFDVLEHVSSPVSLASTVFKLLKLGGLVCITVPRLDRYPRVFDIVTDSPPHHFTLWTSNALSVLLKKVGFEEIRIIEKPLVAQDFLLHVIWRAKKLVRKTEENGSAPHGEALLDTKAKSPRAKSRIVVKLAKSLMLLALTIISWILRVSRLGRGHTLAAIARKPR